MDTLRNVSLGQFARAGVKNSPPRAGDAAPFHPNTIRLYLLVAAYVVCPLIDVPLVGLSLSAPLMYLVMLEVFLRPPESWLGNHRRWIAFAAVIWLSKFYSAMFNGMVGTGIDVQGMIQVFKYIYWMSIFLVTVYLVARADLGAWVVRVMAYAVIVSGLLRWFEALAWGKIGAWTNPRIFTQNGYGRLFAAFTPLLLALVVDPTSKRRGLLAGAILLIVSAAAINGSRGSWVGLAAGITIFLLLYVLAYPKRLKGVAWFGALALGFMLLFTVAPARMIAPVSERFATLEQVEEDKTYLARQLMVQKGLKLFRSSPIFGVGPGRWREVFVSLDIPARLPQNQIGYNRKSAHNSYIYILAETGLVGTFTMGALLLYLAVKGGLAVIALARAEELWALGIYAGFVGMSVHFWVLGGMGDTAPWLMYGLVAAMIMSHKRHSDLTSKESRERWI